MANPVHRSQRFVNAAKTERDRLARRRSQIAKKRVDLQARIDLLNEEFQAVSEEIRALEDLTAPSDPKEEIVLVDAGPQSESTLLKGAAIRKVAVPLLLKTHGETAVHYRDWLGLLGREGYAVAGKRPDAVFLNQVVRSPLVRTTTRAGYYVIDLGSVDRLQAELGQRQSELADLMGVAPTEAGDAFDRHRGRQRELNTAIARIERELDEASAALETWRAAQNFEGVEVRAA